MNLFEFEQNNPEIVNSINCHSIFWHILVVDDDEYVHDVTKLVLSDLIVLGRPLKLHHAFSAKEARELLQKHDQFCMAFIDVVMETDDAGLQLVEWIRKEKKDKFIRLILRTGQPGFAPENYIIQLYDINDYRTKTEFTALKMQTAVNVGVRGFRDIITIDHSLEVFKRLIFSSQNILKIKDLELFATVALRNLLSLLNLKSSTMYILRQETDYDGTVRELVLSRSGDLNTCIACLDPIEEHIRSRVDHAFNSGENHLNSNYFVGYCRTSLNACSVFYVEFQDEPDNFDTIIAELYSTTILLILESLTRQQEVERSQRELLYIVGESVEARSKETGFHVKRVALMCKLLADKLRLPESYSHSLQMAAPLHDIGKIAIPESILHKPGKLDADEWEVMKTHSKIGGDLMDRSELPIAKLASRLARYHHENWDGTGYPEGLSGETIPLEARIMAIVDVIDALGSVRSYKLPWSADQIIKYIKAQSGIKFDPKLVEIACEHFDELTAIRIDYPD